MTEETKISPEWLDIASRLWAAGLTCSQIADRTKTPRGTVSGRLHRHRDMFPQRFLQFRPKVEGSGRTFFEGRYIEHVKRTTQSGAVITMPRVSFIDGVREGAD